MPCWVVAATPGSSRPNAPQEVVLARYELCEDMASLLTEQAGFAPEDIIFDPNILAVATGIEESITPECTEPTMKLALLNTSGVRIQSPTTAMTHDNAYAKNRSSA